MNTLYVLPPLEGQPWSCLKWSIHANWSAFGNGNSCKISYTVYRILYTGYWTLSACRILSRYIILVLSITEQLIWYVFFWSSSVTLVILLYDGLIRTILSGIHISIIISYFGYSFFFTDRSSQVITQIVNNLECPVKLLSALSCSIYRFDCFLFVLRLDVSRLFC